jgi:xeroderma pigmentosum group C-complementing protein
VVDYGLPLSFTTMPRKKIAKRRPAKQAEDDVPEVYREMLEAEEAQSRKRQKLDVVGATISHAPVEQLLQTVFDSSESEDDFNWEDVKLAEEEAETPIESLSIIVEPEKVTSSTKPKPRKPLTNIERRLRLEVHKFHILCLLAHCSIRNHWCNHARLQVSILCSQLSKI